MKQDHGVCEYKGTKYRIVSEFKSSETECFAIDIRFRFLFFPYWRRWNIFYGNAFYGHTERMLFDTPEAAERAFRKKVDEVKYESRVVL